MKEIEYYTTKDGKCPYITWLDSLSLEFQVRIAKRTDRMREGLFGDWKRLKNSKLCELRLDFGKGYRIYFKELNNVIVLFLTAGDKRNQKSDIELAGKYYEDYLIREKL